MSSDKHCCVPRCKSSTVLHGFPNPDIDPERFNTWLNAVRGSIADLEKYYIYKYRRICHSHFDQKYLCRNNRISNIAVPTLNMPEFPVTIRESTFKPRTDHNYSKFISEQTLKGQIEDPPANEREVDERSANEREVDERSANERSANEREVDERSANEREVDKRSANKREDDELSTNGRQDDELAANEPPAYDEHLEDHTSGDEVDPVKFSWQNADQISLDGDKDSVFGDGPPIPTLDMTIESQSQEDGEADKNEIKNEKHTEYFCDSCSKEIIGYTCVQCENYDLCCACEGILAHPFHFMLRVPEHKPFSEVNSILEAVREKINFLTEEAQKVSTDMELQEIKLEEPEFEEVTVDPFSEVPTTPDGHTSEFNTSDKNPSAAHTHNMIIDSTIATTRTNAIDKQSTKSDALSKSINPAYKKDSTGTSAPCTVSTRTSVGKRVNKYKVKSTKDKLAPSILKRTQTTPKIIDLTRLPKTETQAPSLQAIDSERKYVNKRKQDMKRKTYDVGSEPIRNTSSNDQLENEGGSKEKAEIHSEAQKYLNEVWFGDDKPNQEAKSSVKKKIKNRIDDSEMPEEYEYLDEMWLDDTLF